MTQFYQNRAGKITITTIVNYMAGGTKLINRLFDLFSKRLIDISTATHMTAFNSCRLLNLGDKQAATRNCGLSLVHIQHGCTLVRPR